MTENKTTFFRRLEGRLSPADTALLSETYDFAKDAHRGQWRACGTVRFFEHPRAVCLILMDELQIYNLTLLMAGLLHDVGEDTKHLGDNEGPYQKLVQSIRFRGTRLFGSAVAEIIIGLTKPIVDGISFDTKGGSYEYYICYLVTQNQKTTLIKEADRLHNLRTLPLTNPGWIKKQLIETENVYLPIFKSITGEWKNEARILCSKIEAQMQTLQANLSG